MASFVCDVRREIASNSWKAPRDTRCVSDEPARRSNGQALTEELPIWNILAFKVNQNHAKLENECRASC